MQARASPSGLCDNLTVARRQAERSPDRRARMIRLGEFSFDRASAQRLVGLAQDSAHIDERFVGFRIAT
jgi:hypothetical protein